jgi:hypothetical protein
MEPGCIGKSNTNNLPAPTDLTENPYGKKNFFLKERVRPPPAVPPRFRHLAQVFPEKRLELKSLNEQTKAEEEGPRGPFLLSLRLPLHAL